MKGWEIPWFIYKVWGENYRQKLHISSQHMAAGISPTTTIYGPFNIPLLLKPDQLHIPTTQNSWNLEYYFTEYVHRIDPPPSSHHHSTIHTLIARWPRYINFLHMDIEN